MHNYYTNTGAKSKDSDVPVLSEIVGPYILDNYLQNFIGAIKFLTILAFGTHLLALKREAV